MTDPRDVELAKGQSYRVEDASPVIVSGFGPSLARVLRPMANRPVETLRMRLASLLRTARRPAIAFDPRHAKRLLPGATVG